MAFFKEEDANGPICSKEDEDDEGSKDRQAVAAI